MTVANEDAVGPAAFLDTNVLVSLFFFWDACCRAGVGLHEIRVWSDLKSALANRTEAAQHLSGDDAADVKNGIRSFEHLHHGADRYHYFSSQVCWSELHHTLLELHGLECLVRQGIPFSLRQRRPQVLYRRALLQDDYERIDAEIEAFRDSLKLDYLIDVVTVEDPSARTTVSPVSIWNAAEKVWSHVLMEVIDAYIYAAAIAVKADVFVTADNSLHEAIGHLSQPQDEWVPLVASLKEAVGLDMDAALPRPIKRSTALPNTECGSP